MLKGFVRSWNRTRPRTAGRFDRTSVRVDVTPIGALAWLAQESGLPEKTVETVVAARNRTTELRVAEALVVGALQRPEAFQDGTLEVRPNPLASKAARASCCGGSLTGVVEPA
jgi:hypothetical protein